MKCYSCPRKATGTEIDTYHDDTAMAVAPVCEVCAAKHEYNGSVYDDRSVVYVRGKFYPTAAAANLAQMRNEW